jgi:peptide/nickel transport system permease protein
MLRYFLKRTALAALLVLGASALVFTIAHLIPGDLVDVLVGADGATAAQRQALRTQLGLNLPLYVQYFKWLGGLLRGQFGHSAVSSEPVLSQIKMRFPVTLELTALTMLLSVVFGLGIGTMLAIRRNTLFDAVVRGLSLLGLSLPSFVTGILLIAAISRYFPQFLIIGYVSPAESIGRHLLSLFLPAFSMAIPVSAIIARTTRGAVLDEISQDYVRTAHAKGVGGKKVVFRHALRNAMIPIVTQVAFQAGYLLGSAVVIEEVFAIPGLGRMIYNSIMQRDYPTMQGGVLVLAITYITITLGTDLLYGRLDPRIRY